MTESDFAEMIQGSMNNGFTSFTIWLTIVSGYLYVAYSAGRDLTKLQVTIINSLYIVASIVFTASSSLFFSRAAATIQVKAEIIPSAVLPATNMKLMEAIILGMFIVMFSGLLASLYFMINIRREKH